MAKKRAGKPRAPAPNFTAILRGLPIGESAARVCRIPMKEATEKKIREKTQSLRNTVNNVVSIMRTDNGSDFRVESGSYLTNDVTAIIVCITVTRTAGMTEGDALPEDEEVDI